MRGAIIYDGKTSGIISDSQLACADYFRHYLSNLSMYRNFFR